MGNQASKVIERTKERKKQSRRRSTITAQVKANYDWIDDHVTPKSRRQSITEFFSGRKKSIAQDDLKEYDRLQRQHYLLKSARKSNIGSEIKDAITIVDVGTGNGIWAIEMASEYSNCKIIGLDIRPPSEQSLANLKFHEADITKQWPLSSESVDYVYQRNMGQVILKNQWSQVLSEMFRVLKPGGTIELIEVDACHHHPGPVQKAFDEFFVSQCEENGWIFDLGKTMQEQIESSGFTKVNHNTIDIPIGEWPQDAELKQFGFINKEIQKASFRNKKNFYVSKWGITPEDYEIAVQEVLNEFDEYHGFTRFNYYIAKKPFIIN